LAPRRRQFTPLSRSQSSFGCLGSKAGSGVEDDLPNAERASGWRKGLIRTPLITSLATVLPTLADTIYRYAGDALASFGGSDSRAPRCKITGSFTLASPLPNNLSFEIADPISFRFTDSTVVLDQNDSSVFKNSGLAAIGKGKTLHPYLKPRATRHPTALFASSRPALKRPA
jgi:hypothetical protein